MIAKPENRDNVVIGVIITPAELLDPSGTLDDEYPEIAGGQCPRKTFDIDCQNCDDGCIHED
jgi:hypothetical protein